MKINGDYIFQRILKPWSDEEFSANMADNIMIERPFGCAAAFYHEMVRTHPRLRDVSRQILKSKDFRRFLVNMDHLKRHKKSYAHTLGGVRNFNRFQHRMNIRCNNKVCGKYGRNMSIKDHLTRKAECRMWKKRKDGICLSEEEPKDVEYYDYENKKKKYKKWYKCKGCEAVFYCSKKCQKYDWVRGDHKYGCLQIRKYL